jgi:hypothetical protein
MQWITQNGPTARKQMRQQFAEYDRMMAAMSPKERLAFDKQMEAQYRAGRG